MKYTSLYWALRFVEEDLDIHTKFYGDYAVTIYAENGEVDYGKCIICHNNKLDRHKDFVILECVDRLLSKGYSSYDIVVDSRENQADIYVNGFAIYCEQWGADYSFATQNRRLHENEIIYTSRLVSGLLEYKNIIRHNEENYNYGIFEEDVKAYAFRCLKAKQVQVEPGDDINDYEIHEDELIVYNGKRKVVRVPNGIKTIGASAFWNNTFIEEVKLPESVERLGGDCFYYCTNLRNINIPANVSIMGNNPFAGCPSLLVDNNSPYFIIENDVLYDKNKTMIINYPIWKEDKFYELPNTVDCIGKHSFFACDRLEMLQIPQSVKRLENMPFSGCSKLKVINRSPYYNFENGIIYNKFKNIIIGCLPNYDIEHLEIPNTVTLISRNAFWNCKKIKKITIPKSVNRIGYNPFAGCENLLVDSLSNIFLADDRVLYNNGKLHMQCATDRAIGKIYKVADEVRFIDRGVFSGCKSLEEIYLNNVEYIDKSAFTNCTALKRIYISDKVKYVGEWAFAYCKALSVISVNKNTMVDKNAFNECPAIIEWR